jgi:hypothetical protein
MWAYIEIKVSAIGESRHFEHGRQSRSQRYAPDGHFVFVSFASAFLLKVTHSNSTLQWMLT